MKWFLPRSVVVTVRLKRRVTQVVLSTYLPSLCILILAQVASTESVLVSAFVRAINNQINTYFELED